MTNNNKKRTLANHLGGGGPVVRAWDQEVCSSVISGSSPVVALMMVTGGLHGR